MRTLFSSAIAFALLLCLVVYAQPQPPDKLVFNTKQGNVTFNHGEHVKRAGNDCAKCHDALFAKDKTAPLTFKANIHKTAEASKTSCGACHVAGGAAFETKGNCAKCHVK